MAYNKQYNTRFSGRYNNSPGQFMSGGELSGASAPGGGYTPRLTQPYARNPSSFGQTPRKQVPQSPQPLQPKEEDIVMDPESQNQSQISLSSSTTDDAPPRPYWMKAKLPGVKKVSNKERRRRQNENLRRLLTPKNALMVLNEMMPNEQVANQFKVEPAPNNQYNAYKVPNTPTFCADLTIEGNVYKGYGDNKLMARNAAAEQAIRDLIIKKMNKVIHSDAGSANGNSSDVTDEESLPMIQLASFALHKLFTEWEYEGHKVPQLKSSNMALVQQALLSRAPETLAPEPPRKVKELPPNAGAMHPCMLLTYMRPQLEYRELAVEGDRPQKMLFTMAVDVDGCTYVGKAPNKKEARKAAARSACSAIFNIQFDEPAPVGQQPTN